MAELKTLGLFLLASFGAAAIGGTATKDAIPTWYRGLRKPRLNPPNWIFAPVWTMLYVLMSLAAWRVRANVANHPDANRAQTAWWVQLLLNALWSLVFFGRHSPGGGLLVIAPLWLAVATTTVYSARVSRLAGLMLAPYLAWTSFASYLNVRLWQLNRG